MRTNLTLRHIKFENKIPIKKELDELKTVTNVRFRKAIYSGCEITTNLKQMNMELIVTTERQKKYTKFGKWYTNETEVNIYEGEQISTFEHNFFSYNMSAFGAKETRQYGYTCNGYKVVKNFNTSGLERVVTTFDYKN